MALLELGEGVPVGTLAEEMDGQNGLDLVRMLLEDGGCGGCGKVEGEGVDIGEKGPAAGAQEGGRGGEEGKRRGDDGVGLGAWMGVEIAEVGSGKGEPQGVRAGGAADSVRGGAGERGGFLESLYFGAENEAL